VRFGDTDGLIFSLRQLAKLHEVKMLEPNQPGWQYAIREFDEAKDAKAVMRYISALV
jgi:hypothetical protein